MKEYVCEEEIDKLTKDKQEKDPEEKKESSEEEQKEEPPCPSIQYSHL